MSKPQVIENPQNSLFDICREVALRGFFVFCPEVTGCVSYYEITLPPAALPGAKLLKKFEQNF